MSQNTDVLKGGYDAFNSGDQQALTEVFAEDVRWEGSNDKRVPGAGTFDGRDAAMQALGEAVEPFESFSSEPDEFLEEGDTVVVLGHTEARSKSGNDLKVPFVHVWRMEGGKIKRGQLLTDTAAVLAAIS
jgi:uncharacterized protein